MQQATFSGTAGQRIEIAKSPLRIFGTLCFVALCLFFSLAGFLLPEKETGLLIALWLLVIIFVPICAFLALYALRVVFSRNPALVLEPDGVRLNYGDAFIRYDAIERIVFAGSPLLRTIGMRLRRGAGIPPHDPGPETARPRHSTLSAFRHADRRHCP